MQVTLTDGQVIRVGFKHIRATEEDIRRAEEAGKVVGVRAITYCTITRLQGEELVPWVMGRARCARGDGFVKEVGRRLALTRALQGCLSGAEHRADRGLVWAAYWGR
jgi:hypothetical protein